MTPSPMPQPAADAGLPARPGADAALLLDLDGTLLDIAPPPMSVRGGAGSARTLRRLRARLGEALAIVTGRPIEQVDAAAGDSLRGRRRAWRRHAPRTRRRGRSARRCRSPPTAWLHRGRPARRNRIPASALERKERGFVLHYRAAPEAGPELGSRLAEMVAEQAASFALKPASMAWEVRPRGVDKGTAVRELMRLPPFAGRRPVFIGDDVTDEDGIRAARELGGAGYRVPEIFGDAAGVRAWLASSAEHAS